MREDLNVLISLMHPGKFTMHNGVLKGSCLRYFIMPSYSKDQFDLEK